MAYRTAEVRAVEERVASHPRDVTMTINKSRLVNKQVKACHDWEVTCLSERSGFSLTISYLHFGAEEQMKMLPPHQHHLSGMKIEWGQF